MSQPAHESAVVAEFTRTLVVDIPSRLAFGEGIEADQAPSVKFDNALGKTAIINRSVRKDLLKGWPAILIAEHERHRKAKAGKTFAQPTIRDFITIVGEVACDYQASGVGMVMLNVMQGGSQALGGIDAEYRFPIGHHVQVCQHYELQLSRGLHQTGTSRRLLLAGEAIRYHFGDPMP